MLFDFLRRKKRVTLTIQIRVKLTKIIDPSPVVLAQAVDGYVYFPCCALAAGDSIHLNDGTGDLIVIEAYPNYL